MTLDLVQAGLDRAGITYERFDGKVPQRRRHAVITRFRKDPGVKVLLLTLSCGAAGYDHPKKNPVLMEKKGVRY